MLVRLPESSMLKLLQKSCLATLLILLLASLTRADVVVIRNATGGPGIQQENVRIEGLKDGRLAWITSAGQSRTEPIERIFKIALDRDAVLTAAEEAFAEKQWDRAIDNYIRIVRGADEWKRRWAVPRLILSASEANRFDAAVTAYSALVRIDPANASASKPVIPNGPPAVLDSAARDIRTQANDTTIPQQKAALLSFLLELHRARKNDADVAATLDELIKIPGAAGDDPAMNSLAAGIRLGQARVAIEQQKFAEALTIIQTHAERFIDPIQQAEALLLIARSRHALAGDNAEKLSSAAADYMRVVAHFNATPNRPFVADALLGAGQSLIQAKLTDDARNVLRQLIDEFPDSPQAQQASTDLQKIP